MLLNYLTQTRDHRGATPSVWSRILVVNHQIARIEAHWLAWPEVVNHQCEVVTSPSPFLERNSMWGLNQAYSAIAIWHSCCLALFAPVHYFKLPLPVPCYRGPVVNHQISAQLAGSYITRWALPGREMVLSFSRNVSPDRCGCFHVNE